ncbi:MAG: hypothetical protein ACXWMC_02965 [Syntrophales bacterium]
MPYPLPVSDCFIAAQSANSVMATGCKQRNSGMVRRAGRFERTAGIFADRDGGLVKQGWNN